MHIPHSHHRPLLAMALSLLLASPAWAQAPADPAPSPFTRFATSVEFGVALMDEAWNHNETQEFLFEGSGSMWWAFKEGFALGIEFRHVRVDQFTPDAWLQGFSPLIRWRYFSRPNWNAYVEAGPGISWSDRPAPPRGTLFNYLFQSEGGIMRRLTSNTHAVVAFRFLHISNNGREGIARNPDIEALGLRAGLAISFR